ncbi:Putative uncharacterized protein [Lacticaseibacillus paracasei]|nr:Putative uncharacterized protein [Lacticaseibacillus paracasei]
MMWPEMKHDQ